MAIIVNGEKIEDAAIEQEIARLKPDYERVFAGKEKQQPESQLLDWSKENLIEQTLIKQEADKKNYTVTDKDVQEKIDILQQQQNDAPDFKELPEQKQQEIKHEISQQLKFQYLIDDVCADLAEPTDKQIKEFYQENIKNFTTPEQIRVAHIVKHPNSQTADEEAKAQLLEIKSQIDKGEMFETLAKKHSDCPDSGGDLGYITPGQMVEEFEDVVFNLAPDQVSDVFHTRFGYHIAKLYDRREKQITPLEQVKDQIAESVKQQLKTKKFEEYLDTLKTTADIKQI